MSTCPDIAIRIEGAGYRGRPVYFRVLAPWDKPLQQEQPQASWREKAGIIILIGVLLIVVGAYVSLGGQRMFQGRLLED